MERYVSLTIENGAVNRSVMLVNGFRERPRIGSFLAAPPDGIVGVLFIQKRLSKIAISQNETPHSRRGGG
jgi:hypothetical protein